MQKFTPLEVARLTDYFAQELDPDEVVIVERWIDEHPERKRLVDDLRRSRLDLGSDMTAESLNLPSRVEALALSLATIRASERQGQVHPIVRREGITTRHQRAWFNAGPFTRAIGYATGTFAAVILILVAGWYLTGLRNSLPQPIAMSTYATGNGERATITLPDGSTILLNVASRITVPTNYAAGNRTVQLSGEALFTVVHKEKAPFTVLAGASTTRVLGTSFVVRQYATDTAATIAVRDGKVAVGATIVTSAQQLVVGTRGTGVVQPVDFDVFSFETGVLTLKRMTLADAVPELNRWYDVDIRFADPALSQELIGGQYTRGAVADLSGILEWTFGFRVVRDGRVLTLYRK